MLRTLFFVLATGCLTISLLCNLQLLRTIFLVSLPQCAILHRSWIYLWLANRILSRQFFLALIASIFLIKILLRWKGAVENHHFNVKNFFVKTSCDVSLSKICDNSPWAFNLRIFFCHKIQEDVDWRLTAFLSLWRKKCNNIFWYHSKSRKQSEISYEIYTCAYQSILENSLRWAFLMNCFISSHRIYLPELFTNIFHQIVENSIVVEN